MKRKPTLVDKNSTVKVVVITLDQHLASVVDAAREELREEIPNLDLSLHASSQWNGNPDSLAKCIADIETGDIIVVSLLFIEEHINAVLPALEARRDHCSAMIGCLSAGQIVRLTRMGDFSIRNKKSRAAALFARIRKMKKPSGTRGAGAQQMAMLRRVPQILKFIPGTAQDVRAYFLVLQYWLAGSRVNTVNLVRFVVSRYAGISIDADDIPAPVEYPDVGVYHPDIRSVFPEHISGDPDDLPALSAKQQQQPIVGLLVMRSYVLAGNTAHYDTVIRALEARGFAVITAFASGLDARPAIDRYFLTEQGSRVDCVVSLTGFSLVGGPAYNDADAACETLTQLDVPYISAMAIEFQSLEQWRASEQGLMPIELAMMVSIPELDGAVSPMVFGGRSFNAGADAGREDGRTDSIKRSADVMVPDIERIDALAARVERLVKLRNTDRADRVVSIVLYDFPPNSGATGSAAHLSVFKSLLNVLKRLHAEGYCVDVPGSVDELRDRILGGNSKQYGTAANVARRIPVDNYITQQPWLEQIEAQWGPAPGVHQSDGRSVFVLGESFKNVFVGVQPAFGHEGDPMRLLFDRSFAPTHAFSAFYQHLRENSDVVVHFGTHGALEFMPGKQAGATDECWPERLIGDVPNVYLYACNNPSEGSVAKRRSNATLVSYLTPSVTEAGVYRGIADLKQSIEQYRAMTRDELQSEAARSLAELIVAQAEAVELESDSVAESDFETRVDVLRENIRELEKTLIPHGMHVIGESPGREQRMDQTRAILRCEAERLSDLDEQPCAEPLTLDEATLDAIVDNDDKALAKVLRNANPEQRTMIDDLSAFNRTVEGDDELVALVHALDGGYIKPAPGGDVLHNRDVLPTGRNIHGFDPCRLPTAFAVSEGARQADRLLERQFLDSGSFPESIAMVLWGTDNMKTGGGPLAQALAMMGAKPRFDNYGRLCGAELTDLQELGRPRVDVVITMSGIFRDLLPMQTRLLAEASYLAAIADEDPEKNFIRKHALAYCQRHDCDMKEASLRVFSNAAGAYGANVNLLVDSGAWSDEDELAETFTKRKSFAYRPDGAPVARPELFTEVLRDVELTYQNLDSVEVGITTVDNYFDTLGGISRAVQRASNRSESVPVYIGDQTTGKGVVRSLNEQVALDTRARVLNPKWFEEMLSHGSEGVKQIESHVTNTMGWSATTGQVSPSVYRQLTKTFVLDEEMRKRLADLNPTASARVANRLIEAQERQYWRPDDEMLEALRSAGEQLEDQLEGVVDGAAA